MTLGVVRHHLRINRPAAQVWALAGDPTRLHEWFPGITGCTVEGNTRTVMLGSGLPMPEEIVLRDDLQRRFEYRITAPMFRYHRGTIDVLDLGDDTCVAVYTTEADPRTMALTIGGGAADALDELKRCAESAEDA
ncbi:MAG: SRPBCC family protein [Desertimonas sp.]